MFRYLIFKILGNKEKQEYWITKKNVNILAWSNFREKNKIHA